MGSGKWGGSLREEEKEKEKGRHGIKQTTIVGWTCAESSPWVPSSGGNSRGNSRGAGH